MSIRVHPLQEHQLSVSIRVHPLQEYEFSVSIRVHPLQEHQLSVFYRVHPLLSSPSSSADDEAGADDTFLDVAGRQGALDEADEDVGGLLAYADAPLLNGGEHGVAADGTLTVGEAADADILWHPQPHALHGIEDADGRLVVHGEERIGVVVAIEHVGRDKLRCLAVVAIAGEALVEGEAVTQQCVLVAVVAVLRDLEVHLRPVEDDATTSRLNEVGHCVEGTHIVVDHHTAGVHTRADAVVEH